MTSARVPARVARASDGAVKRSTRRRRFVESFRTRPSAWAAALAFAVAVLHGPASSFVYDAGGYWVGARSIVEGWAVADVYNAGWLAVRGIGTVSIYLPSVLFHEIGGTPAGQIAVLIQNAMLIACVGAVLIPQMIRLIAPLRAVQVWVSAVGTASLLSGFAPYPLMDLWAASFVLAGLLLVCKRGGGALLAGGVLLGLAVNLRPAYLVPVGLAAVIWAAFRWRSSPWALAGGLASVLPQVISNRLLAGSWSPWPVQSFVVTNIQTQYAAFVVRYDTVAFAPSSSPQQFYCNPQMASAVAGHVPSSSPELLQAFLANLGDATLLVGEKIAATLFWSFVTPYSNPPGDKSALTVVVLAVTALGTVAVVGLLVRRRDWRRAPLLPALIAVLVGSLVTLAVATPEARFAMPLVLIGILGCVTLIPSRDGAAGRRANLVMFLAAAALAAGLFGLGTVGLAHPATAGDVTATQCRHS